MVNNVYDILVAASLAGGAAVVLVLVLRKILRHAFGAAIAYQSWLIVPVAALVAALPVAPIARPAMLSSLPTLPLAAAAAPVAQAGTFDWTLWVLLAWCAGALVFGLRTWCAHQRFLRKVGAAVERNGVLYAASSQTGPALVGIWRPRIVVPADFAVRFTPAEQDLILAHERMHATRCDTAANLACAAVQCLFWFNPLVHVAVRYVRFDQELACDAAVMQSKPALQRTYAAAMLKAQLSEAGSSISCHWQSHHPLKERIMHLDRTQSHPGRLLAGRIVLAGLICLGGCSALVTQTRPDGELYDVAMEIDVGGKHISQRNRMRLDEPLQIVLDDAGAKWDGTLVLKAGEQGNVDAQTNFKFAERGSGQHTSRGTLNRKYRLTKSVPGTAARLEMHVLVTKVSSQS